MERNERQTYWASLLFLRFPTTKRNFWSRSQQICCVPPSVCQIILSLLFCITRELQVDNVFDNGSQQPSSARLVATAQQLGPQDPPIWKDDSWRTNARFKGPGKTHLPPPLLLIAHSCHSSEMNHGTRGACHEWKATPRRLD